MKNKEEKLIRIRLLSKQELDTIISSTMGPWFIRYSMADETYDVVMFKHTFKKS